MQHATRSDQGTGSAELLFIILAITLAIQGASAASDTIRIQKISPDGTTVMSERTVDFRWMESNLPVYGDGVTHYYHQGPVFVGDVDDRWNPAEDTNVREKDMGAVKGSSLRDLCNLAGGMTPGNTVRVKAQDGFSKTFPYDIVYHPSSRQGEPVITWFRADEGYVPDYATGMRLVFLADNTTNPWAFHIFGNEDWHVSAPEEYWYYYVQEGERYPTTTGLSVQQISEITILDTNPPPGSSPRSSSTSAIPLSIWSVMGAIVTLAYAANRRP